MSATALHSLQTMQLHPPLPDFSAFDADTAIEKKKRRAVKRAGSTGSGGSIPTSGGGSALAALQPHNSFMHAFPIGAGGQAVAALPPQSLSHSHAPTAPHVPAIPHVPAFLSSSQGRPVCPSTPMKSPAMAKLFHTHGYTTTSATATAANAAAVGALPAGNMTLGPLLAHAAPQQQAQHTSAYLNGSPGSARKKGRGTGAGGAPGTQTQNATPTPRSRASSGTVTPRHAPHAPGTGSQKRKERSSSAELLASLSKPAGSGATSPERRMLQGLTPLNSSHSHSSDESGSISSMLQDSASCSFSVCSSQAHSPQHHSHSHGLSHHHSSLDPSSSFLLNSSAGSSIVNGGVATGPPSRDHSGASSLASSFNSSMSMSAGLFRGGLMPQLQQQHHPQGMHMSGPGSGSGAGGGASSLHSSTRRASGSSCASSSAATTALAAPSHFATTFSNLGCIGRGSFGVCYHVLQTAPSPSGSGAVGSEFAVKKSIRPFRGENDRNQKLKEVDNWRLLMIQSQTQQTQTQQTEQLQSSTAAAPSSTSTPTRAHLIDPSTDHLHLVRYYDAWEESGYLYIQSELFRCGTCRHFLDEVLDGPAEEDLIWIFLLDLCRGLRFIHQRAGLIHLDLKWDNTFIATENAPATGSGTGMASTSGQGGEHHHQGQEERGLLKIGDFGLSMNVQSQQQQQQQTADLSQHVPSSPLVHDSSFPSSDDPSGGGVGAFSTNVPPSTLVSSSQNTAEIAEGDQTYLAPEFMDSSLLGGGGGSSSGLGSDGSSAAGGGSIGTAADMFSLGMMMFEVAFDVQLPRRGQAWIDLRNENIDWTGRRYQGQGESGGGEGGGEGEAGSAAVPPRSPALLSLISRLLRRDPSARPSVEDVLSDPTLASYARGERGQAQREKLRNIEPILKPLSRERIEQITREQQLQLQQQQQQQNGVGVQQHWTAVPSSSAATGASAAAFSPAVPLFGGGGGAGAASPFFSPAASSASSASFASSLHPSVHDLDADLMGVREHPQPVAVPRRHSNSNSSNPMLSSSHHGGGGIFSSHLSSSRSRATAARVAAAASNGSAAAAAAAASSSSSSASAPYNWLASAPAPQGVTSPLVFDGSAGAGALSPLVASPFAAPQQQQQQHSSSSFGFPAAGSSSVAPATPSSPAFAASPVLPLPLPLSLGFPRSSALGGAAAAAATGVTSMSDDDAPSAGTVSTALSFDDAAEEEEEDECASLAPKNLFASFQNADEESGEE